MLHYLDKISKYHHAGPSANYLIACAAESVVKFHEQVVAYAFEGGSLWKLIHAFFFYRGHGSTCRLAKYPACQAYDFAKIVTAVYPDSDAWCEIDYVIDRDVGNDIDVASEQCKLIIAPLVLQLADSRVPLDTNSVSVILDHVGRFTLLDEIVGKYYNNTEFGVRADPEGDQRLSLYMGTHRYMMMYVAHNRPSLILDARNNILHKILYNYGQLPAAHPRRKHYMSIIEEVLRVIIPLTIDDYYTEELHVEYPESYHWLRIFSHILADVPPSLCGLFSEHLTDHPIATDALVALLVVEYHHVRSRFSEMVSVLENGIIPAELMRSARSKLGGDTLIHERIMERLERAVQVNDECRLDNAILVLKEQCQTDDPAAMDRMIHTLTTGQRRTIMTRMRTFVTSRHKIAECLRESTSAKNACS